MIGAVLFDLDGTLLDRDASVYSFVQSQYQRFRNALVHVPEEDYISRFIVLDAHGYVWKDKVYQQLVDELGITALSWEDLLRDYDDRFHEHCVPYAGLTDMLNTLKGMRLKLGIITNGHTEFQLANINALGIANFFTEILISEQEGVRKPDPEIFERALNRLNVTSDQSVFVGDHPVNDIQAARNVGIKAIWKRSPLWSNAEADAVVDALMQVPQTVQGL